MSQQLSAAAGHITLEAPPRKLVKCPVSNHWNPIFLHSSVIFSENIICVITSTLTNLKSPSLFQFLSPSVSPAPSLALTSSLSPLSHILDDRSFSPFLLYSRLSPETRSNMASRVFW